MQGEESPGRIAEALSMLDGRMRLRLLARILIPPASYMRARYGPRAGYQLPLIYLARWVGGLWQLLAGRSGT